MKLRKQLVVKEKVVSVAIEREVADDTNVGAAVVGLVHDEISGIILPSPHSIIKNSKLGQDGRRIDLPNNGSGKNKELTGVAPKTDDQSEAVNKMQEEGVLKPPNG